MKLALACLLMCVVACAARVGTGAGTYVPNDSAATCSGYCNQIGMQLSSVVIMASNVGCVCSPAMPPVMAPPGAAPAPATPAVGTASTSAAAGMAALVVAEQARQSQQRQQTR